MLCVVGGKLAEGINFGDGLGRCALRCLIAVSLIDYPGVKFKRWEAWLPHVQSLERQPVAANVCHVERACSMRFMPETAVVAA